MKRNTVPLGSILGISIGLDYSWFLVFALLTWSLATNYFPNDFKNWPVAQYWVVGAATAVMLFLSVLLHEFGHSILALRYKIPVRSITLFIFGGVAQIGAEPPSAVAEFWIAIAGPVVSFALAGLFTLLRSALGGVAPLLAMAQYLAYINGSLGLFNLIPGFPLDGGRVFRAIVWGITRNMRRATLVAANVGRVIAFLFIAFGAWQMFTGNFGGGLWIAFIGWFLESAAVSQVQQQMVQDLLAGHTVSQAMSRNYLAISDQTTLEQLVHEHILGSGQRSFVVKHGDESVGLLTPHHVKEVPRAEWPGTTVAQIVIPLAQLKWVRPDEELWEALQEMDRDGVNQLPVMEDSRIVGMFSRQDLVGFLHTLRQINA